MRKIASFTGLNFHDLSWHFALKSLRQLCFPHHPIFWTLSNGKPHANWDEAAQLCRCGCVLVMWEQLPFSSWLWYGATVKRSMPWLAPEQCAVVPPASRLTDVVGRWTDQLHPACVFEELKRMYAPYFLWWNIAGKELYYYTVSCCDNKIFFCELFKHVLMRAHVGF